MVTKEVVASFGTYPNTLPLNEPVIPSVTNKEPVITAEPENGNPAPAPAFSAYEAVVANDAVPNNEPVIPPLTFSLLLIVTPELDIIKVGLK